LETWSLTQQLLHRHRYHLPLLCHRPLLLWYYPLHLPCHLLHLLRHLQSLLSNPLYLLCKPLILSLIMLFALWDSTVPAILIIQSFSALQMGDMTLFIACSSSILMK
jgi:hypothetical protein